MRQGYSFLKTLSKGVFALIVFAIPMLIEQFPDIASLTIGGVGIMLANFIKYNFIRDNETQE